MWFKSKANPLDTVENALKSRGWKYQRADARHILTGFAHGPRLCLVTILHEADRKSLLFMFNPCKGPKEMFQAVAQGSLPALLVHSKSGHSADQVQKVCEALMEANYRLLLGNFERDPADGEIRFRVCFPYCDGQVTEEQVIRCLEAGNVSVEVGVDRIESIIGSGPVLV